MNSKTTVVNKTKESFNVYIGRGSLFGNPYVIGRDGTREQVIERYKEWFSFLRTDPIVASEIIKLKNKKLGCFCKPLACHGDVIADYVNSLITVMYENPANLVEGTKVCLIKGEYSFKGTVVVKEDGYYVWDEKKKGGYRVDSSTIHIWDEIKIT